VENVTATQIKSNLALCLNWLKDWQLKMFIIYMAYKQTQIMLLNWHWKSVWNEKIKTSLEICCFERLFKGASIPQIQNSRKLTQWVPLLWASMPLFWGEHFTIGCGVSNVFFEFFLVLWSSFSKSVLGILSLLGEKNFTLLL